MESTFSFPALVVLSAGIVAMLFGPRRIVIPVLIGITLCLSMRNRVAVFGLDFMVHRLLVLAGWIRLMMRHEYRGLTLNSVDKVVIILGIWSAFAYVALWGTVSAFIYRMGVAFDVMGLYFLFRALIRSWDDFEFLVKGLGLITAVIAVGMLVEFATGRNPFALLGGLDEEVWVRKGRMRCRGAFGHAISAGIFGASLMALWLACLKQKGSLRRWGIIGLVSSTAITGASGSSTPLLTYLAVLGGFSFWMFRDRLKLIRWSVLATLLLLHVVMSAPVWALLARVNVVGGSTGYHRYLLMDTFIETFGDWWFIGLKDTADWAPVLWDVCNQYVLEGVRGGLLRLGLFILMLTFLFREVGRNRRKAGDDSAKSLMVWSLGIMLFAHCVAFLAYDYWDQIMVVWWLLVASIASLHRMLSPEPARVIEEGVLWDGEVPVSQY